MRRWRSRNVLRTKSVFDVLYRPPKQRTVLTTIARIARRGCYSHARTKFWEAAVATQDPVAREALARIMRMFHLDAMWKNRLPDVRKELRERYLRTHVESFFAFVEEAFAEVHHRRGMLRSALGY